MKKLSGPIDKLDSEILALDNAILIQKRQIKADTDPALEQSTLLKSVNDREKEKLKGLEADKAAKAAARSSLAGKPELVASQERLQLLSEQTQLGVTTKAFSDNAGSFTDKLKAAARASLAFVFDSHALLTAAELSPMFAFMLIGLWAGLVSYVESDSRIVKFLIGTLHAAAHIGALLLVSWIAQVSGLVLPRLIGGFIGISDDITRIAWNIIIALFVGGLLGGLVMGLYWTLTSTLFNMHTGDAFGALGIKDYKNFLRIKLEPGRATIYPIALDRVPGRKGWRWQLNKGEQRPTHNPQVLPVKPLEPRLIEKAPIVIEADKIAGYSGLARVDGI